MDKEQLLELKKTIQDTIEKEQIALQEVNYQLSEIEKDSYQLPNFPPKGLAIEECYHSLPWNRTISWVPVVSAGEGLVYSGSEEGVKKVRKIHLLWGFLKKTREEFEDTKVDGYYQKWVITDKGESFWTMGNVEIGSNYGPNSRIIHIQTIKDCER